MKKSNIFIGIGALILSTAGAFATKVAKINHVYTIAVITSGTCVIKVRLIGVTKTKRPGHTLKVNTQTALTKNCTLTLYTIAN